MSEKIFNPQNAHKLDNPERLKWNNPKKLFFLFNTAAKSNIVEIGVGTGFFTLTLAKQFPEYFFTGLDISSEMIEHFNKKAYEKKLTNIKSGICSDDILNIENSSADIIFMSNVYHEVGNHEKMLQNINNALKPGGKVIIIDWKAAETPSGPPQHERIHFLKVQDDLKLAKFSNIQTFNDIYPFHHIVCGQK
ncbi:MAG: class I SAM-dependent methyltransferase [Candidatus Wallbacteria bacterium]